MKVIFMGTPDFAVSTLEYLYKAGHEISLVVTQPDRPKGRHGEAQKSDVRIAAEKLNIPVITPLKIRTDEEAKQLLRELAPDVIVVTAFGQILPQEILDIPKYGCINVHASLLPKYRGAAPIQWAVLNGDTKTGVCTFHLVSDMDAGDLIYETETDIGETETSGELYDRLKLLGAALLSRTLTDIDRGQAPRRPQNHEEASYVTRLSRELSPIDWNRSPREIRKWIYGLQPWPVATMDLGGQTVKVFSADYSEKHTEAAPGTIVSADSSGIGVACRDGEVLLITQLQAPGKKRMSAADYLRGHRLSL